MLIFAAALGFGLGGHHLAEPALGALRTRRAVIQQLNENR
jgi:hypothetical protein